MDTDPSMGLDSPEEGLGVTPERKGEIRWNHNHQKRFAPLPVPEVFAACEGCELLAALDEAEDIVKAARGVSLTVKGYPQCGRAGDEALQKALRCYDGLS